MSEAVLLKGKPVADALCEEMKKETALLKEKGVLPTLAILRVGEREDDLSYERGAMKRCESVGVLVRNVVLPADVSADTFFETLDSLNKDNSVHGILMFRPLPKHIDGERARKMLEAAKDVDGCTDGSLAGVFAKSDIGFTPCTAEAAMEILHHYKIEIKGKKAAVVGRSLVIGRPVAMLLMHENATVTICHTGTVDVPSVTREADIVIAASGQMESIGKEYLRDGQYVIDVGIGWNEAKGKLCGDVRTDEVMDCVAGITPVPGGVGSVTTCVLVKHVVEAAKRAMKDLQSGSGRDTFEPANGNGTCTKDISTNGIYTNAINSVEEKDVIPKSLQDVTAAEFTQLLASKTSVPGGGGASALVGAIGIALGDMVGEFTVGKKKYADVEADILQNMEKAQSLRVRLLECMDKDAKAFEPLSLAYSIPKDEPGRDETLEKCLMDAAMAPLEILELACEALDVLCVFKDKGSRLMVSDAQTGAAMCRAAIQGAAINVSVNTKLMKNEENAERLNQRVSELVTRYLPVADEIIA